MSISVCRRLQAFEDELRKYMAAEQDVVAIAAKYNAGSLALDAQPLKHSLRSEAASWKAQFARNLHKQGVQNLKACCCPLDVVVWGIRPLGGRTATLAEMVKLHILIFYAG